MMDPRFFQTKLMAVLPGSMVCLVVALVATFIAEHYGGPQLLYALLIGLSLHFLLAHPQLGPGIAFCGRTLLRMGVALLGARITFNQVAQLGWHTALVVAAALALTILCGLLLSKVLRRPQEEGLLSGASVAICGASAAMAVYSVLPQTKENERFTLLTVVGVTLLSTIAMIVYPLGLHLFGATAAQSGIVLGGTIHDVAQVVAAGMMMGPDVADTATVVKLFRVLLLMPMVVLIAIAYRDHPQTTSSEEKVPLMPTFLLGFVVLMLFSSLGFLPSTWVQLATDTSRWFLVIAIAAAGVKTPFQDLLKLGWQPVLLLVTETIFIAILVLSAVLFLDLGLK